MLQLPPTYLPTYLPTYYLPTYLLTYLVDPSLNICCNLPLSVSKWRVHRYVSRKPIELKQLKPCLFLQDMDWTRKNRALPRSSSTLNSRDPFVSVCLLQLNNNIIIKFNHGKLDDNVPLKEGLFNFNNRPIISFLLNQTISLKSPLPPRRRLVYFCNNLSWSWKS